MDELLRFVESMRGVAGYRSLDRAGFPRSLVAAAVRSGALVRVRAGWFALPAAHDDIVRAVRVGGTLTAASVARLDRLWMLHDETLHVRVPRTASRLASPRDRNRPLDALRHRVCVHYSNRAMTGACADLLPSAIIEMFRCGDARAAAVALDSALNRGLIHPEELAAMRPHIPRDKRWTFDQADPNAASGLETLVRLLLSSRRVRFTTQAYVAPAGYVDILIGDRLVLELDGEQFHTGAAFEEDRRRDFALVMQGYLVVRLSYRQVMGRWDEVARGILELVRRDEHLWAGRTLRGPYPA